jgi:uncharacterized membrane protein YgcG
MTDTPSAAVAPGFLAFVAFFLLAMSLWFLMKNMNSRMRRMSYRQQQAHRGRDEAQAGPGEVGDSRRDDDDRPGEDPSNDGGSGGGGDSGGGDGGGGD